MLNNTKNNSNLSCSQQVLANKFHRSFFIDFPKQELERKCHTPGAQELLYLIWDAHVHDKPFILTNTQILHACSRLRSSSAIDRAIKRLKTLDIITCTTRGPSRILALKQDLTAIKQRYKVYGNASIIPQDVNKSNDTRFILPSHIHANENLPLGAVRIAEYIFSFLNNDKPCFPSIEDIKAKTGIKQSSYVYKCLRKLDIYFKRDSKQLSPTKRRRFISERFNLKDEKRYPRSSKDEARHLVPQAPIGSTSLSTTCTETSNILKSCIHQDHANNDKSIIQEQKITRTGDKERINKLSDKKRAIYLALIANKTTNKVTILNKIEACDEVDLQKIYQRSKSSGVINQVKYIVYEINKIIKGSNMKESIVHLSFDKQALYFKLKAFLNDSTYTGAIINALKNYTCAEINNVLESIKYRKKPLKRTDISAYFFKSLQMNKELALSANPKDLEDQKYHPRMTPGNYVEEPSKPEYGKYNVRGGHLTPPLNPRSKEAAYNPRGTHNYDHERIDNSAEIVRTKQVIASMQRKTKTFDVKAFLSANNIDIS